KPDREISWIEKPDGLRLRKRHVRCCALRRELESFFTNIPNDADYRRPWSIDCAQPDALADRIAFDEVGCALADDHDRRMARIILIVEPATLQERHSDSRKVVRTYFTPVNQRRRLRSSFEEESAGSSEIRIRQECRETRGRDARQSVNTIGQ